MSELSDKSKYNFDAAELLMRNHSLYAPSVHCAYYSCIQYMLHIIFNKLPLPYQEKYNQGLQKGSSHKVAIQIIKLALGAKPDKEDYTTFQKKVGELKQHREDSDYSQKQITQDISVTSIAAARSVNSILRSNFK